MKKIYINLILVLLISVFISSCEPTIGTPLGTGKLGTLATSKESMVYVALGNSISAGYMDGAVYSDGEKYSFPNLLAQQIGLTNFVQPDVAEPGIGLRAKFKGFDTTGLPIISISTEMSSVSNLTYPKPYNNLGIPGAVVNDLIDTSDYMMRSLAYSNPFYASFLRSGLFGKSMVEQAINLQPTLLTIEMGANDVLLYATSGGTVSTYLENGKPMPTPAAGLGQLYGAALAKLTTALPNTKIILFTVPEVTGTPFFRTVPWNALVLTDTTSVALLNASYKALGFTFTFKLGANGFVAQTSTGSLRQLTAEDALLLTVPQDSLHMGMGSMKPIPKKYVLFKEEIAIVKAAVAEYNSVINGFTTNPNIKVFDLNQVFVTVLSKGFLVPGSNTMNASFISGELFSTDGIHPTPRGYGAITNELIRFLNVNYGSDIPMVEIQNLRATKVYN